MESRAHCLLLLEQSKEFHQCIELYSSRRVLLLLEASLNGGSYEKILPLVKWNIWINKFWKMQNLYSQKNKLFIQKWIREQWNFLCDEIHSKKERWLIFSCMVYFMIFGSLSVGWALGEAHVHQGFCLRVVVFLFFLGGKRSHLGTTPVPFSWLLFYGHQVYKVWKEICKWAIDLDLYVSLVFDLDLYVSLAIDLDLYVSLRRILKI